MRWKWVFTVMAICLTLGLCAVHTDASASSKYMIKINKQKNTVTVYRNKNGNYKPYKAFVCSVGKATPTGKFRIYQKHRWRALVESTYGQYCSRIVGSILFHSVWYYKPDPATLSNEEYNKLGTTASHGCIRLTVRDAKWIYDHCSMGTSVVIYKSDESGPLGKPKAIKLPKGTGYDPTDTWSPGNPYNKKNPKIMGAKNKTITYGDTSYNVRDGIRARNTTGFDATKQVKITVKYKKMGERSYEKVKKVNTKKPGLYQVTYRLTDQIGRKAKVTVVHKVLAKKKPPALSNPPEETPGPTPIPTPSSDTPTIETQAG